MRWRKVSFWSIIFFLRVACLFFLSCLYICGSNSCTHLCMVSLIPFTIHSCDMSACVEDCDCEGYNCNSSNCVSDCEGVDLTICKDHCDCDINDGSVDCDMPACTKDCRCDGGGCAMPVCQNWCKCFGGDCTTSMPTQNYPGAPLDGSVPSWCANVDPWDIPYVAECLTDTLPAWCADVPPNKRPFVPDCNGPTFRVATAADKGDALPAWCANVSFALCTHAMAHITVLFPRASAHLNLIVTLTYISSSSHVIIPH